MNWKIGLAVFTGLFWVGFAYSSYHRIPGPLTSRVQTSTELAPVKQRFAGYDIGETRAELVHHLRANGWSLYGPGMFYRETLFSRSKGSCGVSPKEINCHLHKLPIMTFVFEADKVIRVAAATNP